MHRSRGQLFWILAGLVCLSSSALGQSQPAETVPDVQSAEEGAVPQTAEATPPAEATPAAEVVPPVVAAPPAPVAKAPAPKTPAPPEPQEPPKTVEHRIGVAAGTTTGIGLSFGRLSLTSGWGWNVSAFPFWSNAERFLSFGARTFKILHEKDQWRLYAGLGGMLLYTKGLEDDGEDDQRRIVDQHEEGFVSVGPFIGIEMKVEALSISLELPAAAIIPVAGDGEFMLVPYPGGQFFFRW